jgi:hypothetical protein
MGSFIPLSTVTNTNAVTSRDRAPAGSGSVTGPGPDGGGTVPPIPPTVTLATLSGADDLRALEALGGTGYPRRTALNTWSLVGAILPADGDYGDITVSGAGSVWTVDAGAIDDSKISDVGWAKVSGTPTDLAGYGITDAVDDTEFAAFQATLAAVALSGQSADVVFASGAGLTSADVSSALDELAGMIGAAGLADGDYGDITVSSGGTVWTIDALAVTDAKINSVAWSKITSTPTTRSGYGITDAQPLDSDLTAIAALSTTSFGRSLLTQADAAATRATIGAGTSSFSGAFSALSGIPTTIAGYGLADAQPLDADLTAIAALATTAFGRGLLTEASASTARTTLGLVIGTNVQAQDAELAALAGLTSAADSLPYFTGSGTAAVTTLSAFARTFIDDADAATVRATIGAGTSSFAGTFAALTGKPTTLSGYGITDAASNGLATGSGLTMSTARILGRTTAATGAIEELTVGTSLSLSAGSLNTIQGIRTTDSPGFTGININSGSGAYQAIVRGANTVLSLQSTGVSPILQFVPSSGDTWRVLGGLVATGDFGLQNETRSVNPLVISGGTTTPTITLGGSSAYLTLSPTSAAFAGTVNVNGGSGSYQSIVRGANTILSLQSTGVSPILQFIPSSGDTWRVLGGISVVGDFGIYNETQSAAALLFTGGTATPAATFAGSIKTSSPSGGTAAAWKLGSYSAGLARIDIAGTGYDLAAAGQDLRTTATPQFAGGLFHSTALDADVTALTGSPRLAMVANNGASDSFVNVATNNSAIGAHIYGLKTRSTLPATDANTVLADGDEIVTFGGFGADGASYRFSGGFRVTVDGTPSAGSCPGKLELLAGGGTVRATLKSAGLTLTGSLTTGNPSGGTAQPIKLGSYVGGAPAATGYTQIEINGTAYKLLTAT